jgi:hypothetical protein
MRIGPLRRRKSLGVLTMPRSVVFAGGDIGAPQLPQNLWPSADSWPHRVQNDIFSSSPLTRYLTRGFLFIGSPHATRV